MGLSLKDDESVMKISIQKGFAEQIYIWLRNKAITSGFCLLLESNVMGWEMFSAITLKYPTILLKKRDKNYRSGFNDFLELFIMA